jgi:ElaB/YqjD/DUF883 family membrane-anchored ribosome-binding protein
MTQEQYERYDTAGQASDVEVDPEAERIVAEIEVTRSEMSSTIDEIGHRLQPETIADQAKTKIREATVGRVERIVDDAGTTAQRTGNSIMETVRQNPVPAALAAIGVGWLALKMRDQGSANYGNGNRSGYGYGSNRYGRSDYGSDWYRGDTTADGGIADDAAQRAREVGADVRRQAGDAVEQSQERVRQAQWQAQRGLEDVQQQAQQTWQENPLALGALAVGVGAAVALAIPETQKERELLGEQRDQLVRKVSSVASDALDEAQSKANEVSEQATAGSSMSAGSSGM